MINSPCGGRNIIFFSEVILPLLRNSYFGSCILDVVVLVRFDVHMCLLKFNRLKYTQVRRVLCILPDYRGRQSSV